jgi:hypothetical protein
VSYFAIMDNKSFLEMMKEALKYGILIHFNANFLIEMVTTVLLINYVYLQEKIS